MGWLKNWRERRAQRLAEKYGQKSYSVQLVVGDDGFMVSQNFSGGSLYTVYTQALWTYICAHRISLDVSTFPAIVQERIPGTERWALSPQHQLNDVLERPYGTAATAPRMTWQQMIATGVLRQELGGNQFYRIVSTQGRLLALQLYLSELIADADKVTGLFSAYRVQGTNALVSSAEVVNVLHANPDLTWSGVSATVANEQATRVDYAASRRTRYDMETRVAPGVVFKVKGLFTVSSEQRDATEAYLAAQYEGATKAGKSLVVGDSTEIQGAPLHQVDDIPTHAANARDAIISSFGVSPPTVGVLRDARYQTWDNALRAQYALCIGPRISGIYRAINAQAIRPIYGPDVRIWFDLVQSPLGLAALRERAETAAAYQGLGWPAKHLNDRFGLDMPEFEGWDTANMGAVVAGHAEDVSAADAGPPPDDDEEDDA